MDRQVVVWVREFFWVARRVRLGRKLTREVRVTSGVQQGMLLVPLLFVAYVNDMWRNIESTIRLFTVECIIYKEIINK
jgi:hypothetical protein